MSKIEFLPCMALDAICFIEKSHFGYTTAGSRGIKAEQRAEIQALNTQLPLEFSSDPLSMSTLSLIISAAAEGALEELTLDDLIELFEAPEYIAERVRTRITTGFLSSFVYPMLDMLIDGYAAKYVAKCKQLKEIGFEEQYHQRVFPLVQAEIKAIRQRMNGFDTNALLDRIAILKNCPAIPSVKIYISFFSYPTAFALYGGTFLSCFDVTDYFSLTAHELMHGFADEEVTEMYRQYTASNPVFQQMHRRLITDQGSGDEEEFVVAAQHYLCLLSGRYNPSELMSQVENFYGGCCPVAVILFGLLSQEISVPSDYNAWLKTQFASNRLSQWLAEQYGEARP